MEASAHPDGLAIRDEERRQESRLPVDEPASVLAVAQGLQRTCRIVEISRIGCRMQFAGRFDLGGAVRVEAAFKLRGVAFRLAGETIWSNRNGQVGIRFFDLTSRRRNELIEVLFEIAAENAAEAVRRAAEPRTAENSRAVSGDRRTDDSGAKSGPAPRPTGTGETPAHEASSPVLPSSGSPAPAAKGNQGEAQAAKPAGRERRTDARVQVDNSATILLVNVGSRLRGRILNLSLGGCRIRTEERFPVGIYTRVETEFHLEGLPFRLGGVVQAIQARNCVGIRFLDMSERKRQQVAQLIGELGDLLAEEQADVNALAPERDPPE